MWQVLRNLQDWLQRVILTRLWLWQDIKERNVQLTEEGVHKAEKAFGVDNLYELSNTSLVHYINQALKANYIMHRDVEYVVECIFDGLVYVCMHSSFTKLLEIYNQNYYLAFYCVVDKTQKK